MEPYVFSDHNARGARSKALVFSPFFARGFLATTYYFAASLGDVPPQPPSWEVDGDTDPVLVLLVTGELLLLDVLAGDELVQLAADEAREGADEGDAPAEPVNLVHAYRPSTSWFKPGRNSAT